MVYVELHGDDEEAVAELATSLMEIAVEAGADPDRAWAVSGEAEVERLRAFRHAAAESANLLIERARRSDPSIVKLSTDMSLPGLPFSAALDLYESGLAREELDACVFGHLRENRLNVNLLPRDRGRVPPGTASHRGMGRPSDRPGGAAGERTRGRQAEEGPRGRVLRGDEMA